MAKHKQTPEAADAERDADPQDEPMPAEADAQADPSDITVNDLVPGLEEEVARQEGDALEARIAELEAERDALRDKWARALAEAENVRKRAERDRNDAETYGGTRLARDLLAVYDSLDRALRAADDDLREAATSFVEGIELTQRELVNTFAKHRIAPMTPEPGERFDPNLHQAMFEAPVPGAEPGTIIEVMQSGFVIADRLLRPALVGVAKAPPAEEPAPDEPPEDEGADAPDPDNDETARADDAD